MKRFGRSLPKLISTSFYIFSKIINLCLVAPNEIKTNSFIHTDTIVTQYQTIFSGTHSDKLN